jgi:hypothetical protein
MSVVWIHLKKPLLLPIPSTEQASRDGQRHRKSIRMKPVEIGEDGEAKLNPDGTQVEDPHLKALLIEPGDQAVQVRAKIFEMFNLSVLNTKVNIRLRKKSNGHLLTIDEYLKPNTKRSAYTLECFVPQIRRRPSHAADTDLNSSMSELNTSLSAKHVVIEFLTGFCNLKNYRDNRIRFGLRASN